MGGPPRRAPDLDTEAGMHRFTWDLRYPGAWDARTEEPGSGGPLATPGFYRARLAVGEWNAEAAFEVLIDPRVAADGIGQSDLEEQLALSLAARDAISEARRAASQLDSARTTLEREIEEAGGEDLAALRRREERLGALRAALVTADGRYQQPMLTDQLEYLYEMLGRADQRPGEEAQRRFAMLHGELGMILERVASLLRPT